MNNKIALLPADASILQDTSKLDVSQSCIGGDDVMRARSASPSSFLAPNRSRDENMDSGLMALQGGNMFGGGQANMDEGTEVLNKLTVDEDNEFINRSLVD